MFDRFFDLVSSIWQWLVPFIVVRSYERGVLLWLGNPTRDLEPTNGLWGTGLHLVAPFGIHTHVLTTVVTDMEVLDPQPLTTKDGIAITLQAALTYRVKDVRKLLLETEDRERALHDTATGLIASEVAQADWDDVRSPEFVDRVYRTVRTRGFRYGIELMEIQFPGLQKTRSLTLVQAQKRAQP